MLTLEQDFPENADEILLAARSDVILKEAFADYEQARKRMANADSPAEDRALWAAIHAELVSEIRQRFETVRDQTKQL